AEAQIGDARAGRHGGDQDPQDRQERGPSFKVQRFAGLTLGGGKGRKTCLSILEYFVKEKKIFLTELHENIEDSERLSADSQIIRILDRQKNLKKLAIDAPVKLPKCLRCRLVCPGHEKCNEPEIKWMWKTHKKKARHKRPNKLFTPYTERCAEQYLASEFGADFVPDHGFGSNRAPIAARALYLKRRLNRGVSVVEVLPKVSLLQLAKKVGLRKNQIAQYKQLTKGPEIRRFFLDHWSEHEMSFIYHRDFKSMVKDGFAFDSFISAYTGFLESRGACAPRPKGFPASEAWITYPE
ncbi:MAG: DUF429 domain-containing protein, partial [Pseudomonadota bacterium]